MWINPRDYIVIGQRLTVARKNAGLTQVDLGKRLGKPQSFVSDYESRQRRVDLLELGKIAQAMGREVHGLFEEIFEGVVPVAQSDLKPGKARRSRKKPNR